MGRFAYQPLSEEFAKLSQPGQLIMNRFDGHISANKNGIIVSKTKEIEDKIADINELKHDVDEQSDVVSNLIEDLNNFLNDGFTDATNAQDKTYSFDKQTLYRVRYLDNLYKGMKLKLDRIQETIDDFKRANDLQTGWMDSYELLADDVIKKIGDMSYVESEYNTIMALKMTYDGGYGG